MVTPSRQCGSKQAGNAGTKITRNNDENIKVNYFDALLSAARFFNVII